MFCVEQNEFYFFKNIFRVEMNMVPRAEENSFFLN